MQVVVEEDLSQGQILGRGAVVVAVRVGDQML
jgi:hypothetical protein